MVYKSAVSRGLFCGAQEGKADRWVRNKNKRCAVKRCCLLWVKVNTLKPNP